MPVDRNGIIRAPKKIARVNSTALTPEYRAVLGFFDAFPIARKTHNLPDADLFLTLLAMRGFKVAPLTLEDRALIAKEIANGQPTDGKEGELSGVRTDGLATANVDPPAGSERSDSLSQGEHGEGTPEVTDAPAPAGRAE